MVTDLEVYMHKCALYDVPRSGRASEGFAVWVQVLDGREVFGRIDLKVQPYEGHGTRWVSLNALNSFIDAEDMG